MVHDHIVVMATKEKTFGTGTGDMSLYDGIKIRASLHLRYPAGEGLRALFMSGRGILPGKTDTPDSVDY